MRIRKAVNRWFEIPGDPDNARVHIHHLTPEESDSISDKAFTQDIVYEKGRKGKKGKSKPVFTNKVDNKLFRELSLQKAVIGWENFFDAAGGALECTFENILKIASTVEEFSELVSEFRDTLAEDIAQEREDQRKNLSSSASEPAK